MSSFRVVSPRWLAELKGRTEFDHDGPTAQLVMHRICWYGTPLDVEHQQDFRFDQLFCWGLIDRAELVSTLAELEAKGRIVDAEQASAEAQALNPGEGVAYQGARETLLARARVGAISQLADYISGDIGGYGTDALKVVPGLADRLAAIEQQLREITDALHAKRKAVAAERAAALKLSGARNLKLHLGAGRTHLKGWVNIETSPAELGMNVSWGLPFEDGSVSFVYAGLVFEHLYYAAETLALLREVKRVLAPGGVFRIIVPNMELFLRKYVEGDRAFFDKWQEIAIPKHFRVCTTPMEIINMYNGTCRNPSEYYTHKFGYDFETLEKLGRIAGYSQTKNTSYMASEHPELHVDEISRAAPLQYNGEYYSLFVEFVK